MYIHVYIYIYIYVYIYAVACLDFNLAAELNAFRGGRRELVVCRGERKTTRGGRWASGSQAAGQRTSCLRSAAPKTKPQTLIPQPTPEQLLHKHVQRFRGGLVSKAHRLCVSLNSRLESNKEEEGAQRRCLPRSDPPRELALRFIN